MNDLGSCELRSLDSFNNSRVRMRRTIFGREPMTLNDMNNSGLWMTQGCELRALDVINNSSPWITRTTPDHELRALDAMNNSTQWLIYMAWVHGFGCYELLRVLDDMNDLRSYELKSLGAMKSLRLWMIWMILGHESKALNVMNWSRLWMTHGHQLKALHAMNNLGLWLTWITLCC